MKKIFTLLLCCASLSVSAQYQIPNSDFELWDTETYNTTTGDAPVAWNSFLQGSGGLQNAAAANQLSKSNDIRPGSKGTYSAKIIDRYINYIVVKSYAQGNLTTGCINMGSATANNPGNSASANNSGRGKETLFSNHTGNYNWTNINDTTHNAQFTGFPDAMHVWIKYYSPTASYRAKATTVLHTNGYYQDPLPKTDDCEGDLVGTAANTNIAPDANNWQELTIPFSYPNGTTTRPSFALVTFSTNATPGTGTGSDYMLIDDLEYIYYSTLSNLKYDNTNIEDLTSEIVGLGSNEVSYTLYDKSFSEDLITFDIDGKGATAEKEWNSSTKTYKITVKGDDWSKSNKNQHVYKIHFVNNSVLTDLKFNEETIDGFSEDTYNYAIQGTYTDGCITYTPNGANATVEKSWDDTNKVYTITVKGVDHSDTPDYEYTFDNKHTYTIKFYDLIIKDGETNLNEIENGSGKKVLLKRTFKAGWNTICLPFASNSNHWGGSSVKFYTLNSNTDGVLSFTNDPSPYDKNVPYLVYLPNEINEIEFKSRTIEVDENTATKTAGDWTFTGSYEPSISMEGKWGVVNDGSKVRKGGDGSTLKSTRAYLEYNGAANVNEMRIIIDGEETTITEIDGMPVGNFDVYNLQGVRVRQNVNNLDGLNKGIYIVNGKKHIVK